MILWQISSRYIQIYLWLEFNYIFTIYNFVILIVHTVYSVHMVHKDSSICYAFMGFFWRVCPYIKQAESEHFQLDSTQKNSPQAECPAQPQDLSGCWGWAARGHRSRLQNVWNGHFSTGQEKTD